MYTAVRSGPAEAETNPDPDPDPQPDAHIPLFSVSLSLSWSIALGARTFFFLSFSFSAAAIVAAAAAAALLLFLLDSGKAGGFDHHRAGCGDKADGAAAERGAGGQFLRAWPREALSWQNIAQSHRLSFFFPRSSVCAVGRCFRESYPSHYQPKKKISHKDARNVSRSLVCAPHIKTIGAVVVCTGRRLPIHSSAQATPLLPGLPSARAIIHHIFVICSPGITLVTNTMLVDFFSMMASSVVCTPRSKNPSPVARFVRPLPPPAPPRTQHETGEGRPHL